MFGVPAGAGDTFMDVLFVCLCIVTPLGVNLSVAQPRHGEMQGGWNSMDMEENLGVFLGCSQGEGQWGGWGGWDCNPEPLQAVQFCISAPNCGGTII